MNRTADLPGTAGHSEEALLAETAVSVRSGALAEKRYRQFRLLPRLGEPVSGWLRK
jgi:hypothetical protein